ncbi:MAG: hypothetical protein ACLVB5_07915 [Christensenellales bacterium]
MAGAVPGIVLGCAMMALCFFMGKKYGFPAAEPSRRNSARASSCAVFCRC